MLLASDIDGAIELLESTGADSVIGFTPVGERSPARMRYVSADRRISTPAFAEAVEGIPRQALPILYLRDGGVYVTRVPVLMRGQIQGDESRAWLIPEERSCGINTSFDLWLAEQMLLRDGWTRTA